MAAPAPQTAHTQSSGVHTAMFIGKADSRKLELMSGLARYLGYAETPQGWLADDDIPSLRQDVPLKIRLVNYPCLRHEHSPYTSAGAAWDDEMAKLRSVLGRVDALYYVVDAQDRSWLPTWQYLTGALASELEGDKFEGHRGGKLGLIFTFDAAIPRAVDSTAMDQALRACQNLAVRPRLTDPMRLRAEYKVRLRAVSLAFNLHAADDFSFCCLKPRMPAKDAAQFKQDEARLVVPTVLSSILHYSPFCPPAMRATLRRRHQELIARQNAADADSDADADDEKNNSSTRPEMDSNNDTAEIDSSSARVASLADNTSSASTSEEEPQPQQSSAESASDEKEELLADDADETADGQSTSEEVAQPQQSSAESASDEKEEVLADDADETADRQSTSEEVAQPQQSAAESASDEKEEVLADDADGTADGQSERDSPKKAAGKWWRLATNYILKGLEIGDAVESNGYSML